MIGKKKKESLPPFNLQVLTTEYLIDGTVDGDSILYFPDVDAENPPIILKSVKIQSTRPVVVPPRTCSEYALMGSNTIAIIPGLAYDKIPEHEDWEEYEYPVNGIFYFGPYLIQGKLMKLNEELFDSESPMFNVHITSIIPGTHWGEIYTPFALLNTNWLHGYEPLKAGVN